MFLKPETNMIHTLVMFCAIFWKGSRNLRYLTTFTAIVKERMELEDIKTFDDALAEMCLNWAKYLNK